MFSTKSRYEMSISFSGLASGLDTSSWVTSLTQLRQAKITTLETQKTSIAAAQSTLQGIRSFFASFRSSIEKITDSKFNVSSMDIFSKKIATVSNAAVLSATAKSNAAEGSYEVKVKNTATQTQVKSGYRYKTTLVSTTQATTSSYLRNIGIGYGNNIESGITVGDIEIDHNNVTSRISISANETMSTFLDKLHNVGINADFNDDTGIFSIDVNRGDIRDIGNTNILNKLNIADINFGYTGNQLKIEESHEEYHQATNDTFLSELGVHTGTLTITTANGDYEVTLDNDDTIGSLVSALRSEGIEATFNEGVFSINNAYVSSDGTTGLIEHFGLSTPAIASQSQESGGLKYQTVYSSTTTAHLDSYLKDIDGVDLSSDKTIVVKNASGVTSTITVGTSTTIGGLVSSMNAAGVNLNASFDETTGTLSIQSGWIIEGGTFDVEAAFGLEYTGVPATITGDALTVTTTTVTGATGATKLKDLTTAVTNGTIKVTDTSGNDHNLVIDANDTIDQFTAKVRALGLGANFDNTTGTLTLVGGSYTTAGISAANRSNILNVFFGADTLTPSAIDSASSTSQALREATVTTYAATGTTTLEQLGMNNATYTATFRRGTTDVNISINGNTSISDLVSTLRTYGVDAEFNADTHRIMITDGEFVGVSGGNFDTLMNFTSTVTGRYATSNVVMAQNITTGVEMTSSGAVYYTVTTTNTITHTVTTTTPITSSSAPLTYDTITTTTTGATVGIEITGASSISYQSVTTAGTAQTTGTLNYITTSTTPGSTTTVGSTLTSGSLYEPVTAATSNTSGTLTYTVVNPGSSYMETLGIDFTSSTMYVTTTTPQTVTTPELSYESITPGTTYITTTGATTTGGTVYVTTTAGTSQSSSTLTYQTVSEGTTYIATTGITETGGAVYVTTTAAAQQSSDTLTYQSVTPGATNITTEGLSTTSWVMYVTTTVAKSQTTGVLSYNDIVEGVTTTTTVGLEMTGTSVIIGSTSPIEQTGSALTYDVITESIGESTTQGIVQTATVTLTYDRVEISNSGNTTTGITTTLQSGVLTYTSNEAATSNTTYLLGQTGEYREEKVLHSESKAGSFLVTTTSGQTAKSSTKMSEFGMTSTRKIYIYDSTSSPVQTITVQSTDTVGSVMAALTAAGFTSTILNNATNGYNVTIGASSTGRYINASYPLAYMGIDDHQLYDNVTVIEGMTEDTRISSLRAYYYPSGSNTQGDYYFVTVMNVATGATTTQRIEMSGATVGDFVDVFQSIGYSAGVTDGKFWFTPEPSTQNVVVGINNVNNVDDLLGLSGKLGSGQTYTTGYSGSTCNRKATTITVHASSTESWNMTATLASLGFTDNMVVKKSNGTSTTITSSTTLRNALKVFAQNGFSVALDGSTYNSSTITSVTGYKKTIKITQTAASNLVAIDSVYNLDSNGDGVDSGTLVDASKLGYGRSYTFTSQKTVTNTATGTKTLQSVGLSSGGNIITSNGTVTVTTSDTINTFVNNLKAKLGSSAVSYNATTGKLSINNTASKYIINATGAGVTAFLNRIGIEYGEGETFNVSGGSTITTTTQAAATVDTYLSELGLTSDGTFSTNTGTIYTVHSDDTLGYLLAWIGDGGISADISLNGVVTIWQDSDHYFTSMSPNLRDLLGITSVGENYTYTIIEGGTYTTTSTATATTVTTLSTLGFTGSGTITFGDGTTATLTGSSTINDFLLACENHYMRADMRDGYINIDPRPDFNYIADMTPGLAQALGLQLGEGHMYETIGDTITADTTLGDLGLMGNSYLIETDDDMLCFDTNSTIQDVIDGFEETGNFVALLDEGMLTISPIGEHHIVSIDSNLRVALGLANPGEGVSYSIHTQATQPTTDTVTATTGTTLDKFGLNTDAIVRLSNGESITLNGSNTIGDLQSFLNDNGITFSMVNGSITVGNASNSNYITYSDLSTVLGIRAGEGDSYNVSSRAAVGTDKLETLGFTGEYSIVTNNTTVLKTATADTTLNDLVGVLQNNAGLSASLSNGNLTISPNNGNYLMDMTSDLATKLGNIRYGLGDSYNIDIQILDSSTETITATTATALSNLGLSGNAVVALSNGNSVTLNGSNTIGDLQTFLGNNGITFSMTNGVITVGSVGNTNYITASDLATVLGIRGGNGYSYNDGSVTVSGTTTLAALGLNGNYTIKTDNSTIEITGSSSINNIISSLTAAGTGLGASLSNGKLTITAQNGHYVTEMSQDLENVLNFRAGEGYTYQTDLIVVPNGTSTVTATNATSFGQLGLTGNYIVGLSNGQSQTFTSGSTIADLKNFLNTNNISCSISATGVLTTGNNNSTNYITYSDLFALGIRAGEGYSYNSTSSTLKAADTLSSLGLSGDYTIKTDNSTIALTGSSSISNIISSLTAAGTGLGATLVNGVLTITPQNGHYLTDMSPDLAAALNLQIGNGYSYNTDLVNVQASTATVTATAGTNLGQLGLTGNSYVVSLNNGNSITMNANSTIGALQTFLSNNSITFGISNGSITVGNSSDTNYITHSDLFELGIRAGDGYTYNTSSRTLAATDTLSSLGLTGSYTIKTDNSTIVLTGDSTINNMMNSLTASATGLGASLSSGKLTVTAQNGHYVKEMSPELALALGIQVGEGSTYNTNFVHNEPETITNTATTGTSLSQLGMRQTGYINVSNGSVVTLQTDDTIATAIVKLASVGITATMDTGTFTIGRNTDANYVTSMSSWVSTALGVEAGEGYTFNSGSGSGSASSTFASLGMQGDIGVIKTRTATVTVHSTDSLSAFTLAMQGTGVTATISNGVLTLTPEAGNYIADMSSNLETLFGMETGYGESYSVNIVDETVTTNTINATTSTKLSQIGLNGSYVIGLNNGNSVTLNGDSTINTLKSFLEDNNITCSISNGKITVGSTSNSNYITYSDLYEIGIRAGEGKSYNSTTSTVNATTATTLGTLGFGNGLTNYYGYIYTNSGTITVSEQTTLGQVISALGSKGLTASLTADNKLNIKPTTGHYLDSLVPDSLAAILGNIETGENVSYRIIDEVTNTAVATATSETTLGILGLTSNSFLLTDDGRTVTAEAGDTISNFISKLAGVGITATYNASTGVFNLGQSTDTNFATGISPTLQSVLGNILVGENATYTVGTHEEYTYENVYTPTIISTAQTFGDIGITAPCSLTLSTGQNVSVTANTTIGSFLTDLTNKGITATLSNGLVNLKPQGGTYITGHTGQDILGELNIVGTCTNIAEGTLSTSKLKDLVNSYGTNLGITSGNIKVYKNGIASTITIDNNITVEDLANQLSNYNIQMVYSSSNGGKLYFTSSGDSYLSEVSGGTNLLSAIGAENWTAVKATSSQSLEYEVGSDEVISGDTKLVNLKNSGGSSLGITAGKYKIKAAGISYEGTITASTSVNDFFTDIARYGITGSISSDGQITLNTSNDDTYLEKANGASGYSNVVDTLFPSWTFGNIYISNDMDVTTVTTVNMTSETKLKDIDQGDYVAGKLIVSNRNTGDTVIELAADATVGDFMAALSYHGFNAYIENGRLIARNDGYTTLKNYTVPSQASNVLDLLGFDNTSAWEQPGYYTGSTQTATTYRTVLEAATRETKLSNLRDASGNSLGITTGKYVAYSNGVAHTVNLSSTDITLDSFMNTLAGFGIDTIFDTQNGQSVLKLTGSGDSYVTSASGPGASNVIQKLFGNGLPSTLYNYQGYEQTTEIVSTTVIATLGTSLSDYDHGNVKSEGVFALTVDGEYSEINITSYETFGSLLEKFERAGVQASLVDGVLRLETGNKTFVVDEDNTTSNLISNLGLYYSNNLGGFAASASPVTQTTTTIEDRTLSVAKYADYDTQLGLLNISSGTLSIYRNGAKQLITIDNTETFSQLRARINDAFGDVDIDFNKGKLRFFSTTEGIDVQVGSSNDTSNMSSICGFSQDEDGYIVSARELYKVNASSVVTTSDLFRYGDVTEGTFIIGDETFTINSTTTIQNIVSQINSSEKANASAYWDSVDGKLVISSRSTGASMVNIEAGTSNFTDILGLTSSEWNPDGSVKVTRIKLDSQELGNNASFTINGTNFQSASNVITSDVSRIQGLTLNLKSASAGDTVTITVGKDAEAVTEAVGEFVEAYNDLVDNVDTELSTGVLKDQSTLKFIRQQIRSLLMNTFAGATTFRNLAALGISTSAGNTISVGDVSASGIEYLYFDTEKFLEGYNKDPDAVKNMLVGTDNAPGILLQIENIVENALQTGTGYFSVADKSYSDKINSINEKIRKANQAIEAYRARLESKFKSMDMTISQMQNQYNSFLSSNPTSSLIS